MFDHHNIPKVDMEFMNRENQQALAIANRLEALINLDDPQFVADRIDSLMQELVEHHRQHFDHENREMEATHFPAHALHLAEHLRVLGEMEAEYRSWSEGRDVARLRDYLSRRFPSWLMNHLVTRDTVSATYMSRVAANS
ncbi:MAG: hemerythrin family protein [Porticoccaceae bacterium]